MATLLGLLQRDAAVAEALAGLQSRVVGEVREELVGRQLAAVRQALDSAAVHDEVEAVVREKLGELGAELLLRLKQKVRS